MKRALTRLLVFLLFLAGFYFGYPFALNGLARFLIVKDPLNRADLILVLGGDANGERVEQGVELFKQGYAPYILMSGGQLNWRLTYAEWMKKQANYEGIPASSILVQAKSGSTYEDAKFSLPLIEAHRFRSVILVTSPYHTRRAAAVFKKMYNKAGIKVAVYPVEKSEFNPDHWWRRHSEAAYVVHEYTALVFYFLKGY